MIADDLDERHDEQCEGADGAFDCHCGRRQEQRLVVELDRLRKIETAATELLTHWHGSDSDADAVRRFDVRDYDPRLFELIYELAAVVGGLR